MKIIIAATLFQLFFVPVVLADLVMFGSGANQFTMEFVPIGNPGNAADTTGSPNPAGAVSYSYNMGKYEVSRDMVTKASTESNLAITLQDMTTAGGNGVNRPATGVTWNEAARFVNWLNTSQGYQAAYKFTTQLGGGGYNANENISLWSMGDTGFDAANPFRNSLAQYFLPSVDEWYKAAYYDPNANGGAGGYWNYPTGSDAAPTAVTSGTTAGTAVYDQVFSQGPADITQAGGLSAYGVMAMGGNVYEWEETEFDLVNNSGSGNRAIRGGYWDMGSGLLLATVRGINAPTTPTIYIGFRVASVAAVPEPSQLLFGAVVTLGLLCWKWLAD